MKFNDLFNDCPVSFSTHRYWATQDQKLLDEAATVLDDYRANPWVFSADRRHFEQFATSEEWAAFGALSVEQLKALCGHWDEEPVFEYARFDSAGYICASWRDSDGRTHERWWGPGEAPEWLVRAAEEDEALY